MKVIFLDLDGVLNSKQTPNPRNFPFILDNALLERLKHLLQLTGAQVVLSSNWRYDPAGLLARDITVYRSSTRQPDLPGEARCNAILGSGSNGPAILCE